MIGVNLTHVKGAFSKVGRPDLIFLLMKAVIKDASKRLSILFWLIFLHSFFVGLALIYHPPVILQMMGFRSLGEEFFPVQGGIFHILLGIFYLAVVLRLEGFKLLIHFSIIVKSVAFVFLLCYYFLVDRIFIVLVSGILDGVMALGIIFSYRSFRSQTEEISVKTQVNNEFWYY